MIGSHGVERWDIAFANLYLDAVEAWEAGRRPPGPWGGSRCATCCWAGTPTNYDLPQSLPAGRDATAVGTGLAGVSSRPAATQAHVLDHAAIVAGLRTAVACPALEHLQLVP